MVESLGRKSLQLTPNLTRTCCFYQVQQTQTKCSSAHFILLIDRSASMIRYLEELKEIIRLTIRQLKSNSKHRLSVLSFGNDHEVEWLLDNSQASEAEFQLNTIHRRLEESCGDEFTVLSTALETIFNSVIKSNETDEVIQVILITDGYLYARNQSLQVEQSRCYGWILDFTARHIGFQIVGVGACDLNFLTQLAATTKTGDFYPYVDRQSYRYCLKHWIKFGIHLLNPSHQILNNNYFLALQSQHVNHPRQLITVGNYPQLIITFDDILQINQQTFPTKEIEISNEVENQFKLSYAYYLLKQHQVDEAAFLLQETELFSIIHHGYSDIEICQSLNAINRYRYQPQLILPTKRSHLEKPSVLTILEMILNDPFSSLFWKYEQSSTLKIEEDVVTFIPHSKLYFPITKVQVSTTKQNIIFTVKVEGVAMQNQTGLKLDCFIFRNYFFVENGNLKLKQLACQLSPMLRQKLLELKLIKQTFIIEQWGIDLINLTHLKLVTSNTGLIDRSDQVVKQLYELEQTKLKIQILETMIHDQWRRSGVKKQSHSFKLMKHQYQVSDSGLFKPRIKPRSVLKRDATLQLVTEWCIENFSKSTEQQKCYESIQSNLLICNESVFTYLNQCLSQEKKKRLTLQNQIYLLRLQSQLSNQPLFNWDEVKVEHERLNKMVISKQKIGEIMIKENKYFIHSAT